MGGRSVKLGLFGLQTEKLMGDFGSFTGCGCDAGRR